jgi:hypothetical protein
MNRVHLYRKHKELLSTMDDSVFQISGKMNPVTYGTTGVIKEQFFVKTLPVTDLEMSRKRCTANLFHLPPEYNLPWGSTGFTVWRELAAHEMTTQWVLNGQCPHFPILYHWRIVPRVPTPYVRNDELMATWDNNPLIENKLKAMSAATTQVVLVMEKLDCTLLDEVSTWNKDSLPLALGIFKQYVHAHFFLVSKQMVIFDSHFNNIMLDAEKNVYLIDFGLVICPQFTDVNPGMLLEFKHMGLCGVIDLFIREDDTECCHEWFKERYSKIGELMEKSWGAKLAKNYKYPQFQLNRLIEEAFSGPQFNG